MKLVRVRINATTEIVVPEHEKMAAINRWAKKYSRVSGKDINTIIDKNYFKAGQKTKK